MIFVPASPSNECGWALPPAWMREVAGQPQRELLDRPHPGPGERVHGVLLRVGRQHSRVVAGQVGAGHVAGQRDGDVEVGDLVP